MAGEQNILDLNKVQEVMDWLAETRDGDAALQGLADYIEQFRAALQTTVNNAELRYVLERLIQQRNLGNWDKTIDPDTDFNLQTAGALFPQQTGLTRAELSPALAQSARVLNRGFIIKASIPASVF